MENKKQIQEFKRIACKLNSIGSTPVLYGSLGLSLSLNHNLDTDDIDILVEDLIFESKLPEIRSTICSLGYELTDPEENEFENNQFKIGIGTDGDMIEFSGIAPSSLRIIENKCQYRVLSPEQYLATYEASNLDGYRKETHKKDDASKIELIKSKLTA